MGITTDFTDLIKLKHSIKRLGDAPKKLVSKASRRGAKIVQQDARLKAPYQFGFLEKGITLVGERSKTKSKKVFQITFDRKMNDIFQKPIKNPGEYGGEKKPWAYYPASMEHGFKIKGGGKRDGDHFMEQAANAKEGEAKRTIVRELTAEIDKEWSKK